MSYEQYRTGQKRRASFRDCHDDKQNVKRGKKTHARDPSPESPPTFDPNNLDAAFAFINRREGEKEEEEEDGDEDDSSDEEFEDFTSRDDVTAGPTEIAHKMTIEEEDSSDEEFVMVISRGDVTVGPTKGTAEATGREQDSDDDGEGSNEIEEDSRGRDSTRTTSERSSDPDAKTPGACGATSTNKKGARKKSSKKKAMPKAREASDWKMSKSGNLVRTKAYFEKQRRAAGLGPTKEEEEAAKKIKAEQKEELKQKGYTTGKRDAPIQAEVYQFESDEPIPEDDPYFKKGCRRCMVFTSDSVPEEHQYKRWDGIQEGKPIYRNAVDKFYDWNFTRPNSNKRGKPGWDMEGYNEARMPRHFVLKMGPPNGLYGHPSVLAMRLKAVWQEFLRARLRSSHITIETEIPFHTLAGTNYFKSYMDTILELSNDTNETKKLGKRLTIKLSPRPTEALLIADPKAFYAKKIDVDREWAKVNNYKESSRRLILSLVDVQYRANPDHPQNVIKQPTADQAADAKAIFTQQKASEMLSQQLAVHAALEETKTFIKNVRQFEQSKNLQAPADVNKATAGHGTKRAKKSTKTSESSPASTVAPVSSPVVQTQFSSANASSVTLPQIEKGNVSPIGPVDLRNAYGSHPAFEEQMHISHIEGHGKTQCAEPSISPLPQQTAVHLIHTSTDVTFQQTPPTMLRATSNEAHSQSPQTTQEAPDTGREFFMQQQNRSQGGGLQSGQHVNRGPHHKLPRNPASQVGSQPQRSQVWPSWQLHERMRARAQQAAQTYIYRLQQQQMQQVANIATGHAALQQHTQVDYQKVYHAAYSSYMRQLLTQWHVRHQPRPHQQVSTPSLDQPVARSSALQPAAQYTSPHPQPQQVAQPSVAARTPQQYPAPPSQISGQAAYPSLSIPQGKRKRGADEESQCTEGYKRTKS